MEEGKRDKKEIYRLLPPGIHSLNTLKMGPSRQAAVIRTTLAWSSRIIRLISALMFSSIWSCSSFEFLVSDTWHDTTKTRRKESVQLNQITKTLATCHLVQAVFSTFDYDRAHQSTARTKTNTVTPPSIFTA